MIYFSLGLAWSLMPVKQATNLESVRLTPLSKVFRIKVSLRNAIQAGLPHPIKLRILFVVLLCNLKVHVSLAICREYVPDKSKAVSTKTGILG